MILLYHKVYPEAPTEYWVTADDFWRQMEELRRFRVVHLDDYDPTNPHQAVVTFDGVYDNVATYATPILRAFGYPFELFVVGDHVGGDNAFDQPAEPATRFAERSQLERMVGLGGRLQWHSRTHPDLASLSRPEAISDELTVPDWLRRLDPSGFGWFAYPHGRISEAVLEQTKLRFRGALGSLEADSDSRYLLPRLTVKCETRFSTTRVSLVIANYNYARFAAEAIESALRQTVAPDEILFVDDCSQDDSIEVAERYQDRVRIVRNHRNLGIVENFNKAVSLTSGDYVCFLGADNRLRSDYIEKCKRALDLNPRAAVAYTNEFIFGPRAEVAYRQERNRQGFHSLPYWAGVYFRDSPQFTDETRAAMTHESCMHGSSMFRRSAFDQVGGYRDGTDPEDFDLFRRIVEAGWSGVLCPEYMLEYRQHSGEQANAQFNLGVELASVRRLAREQKATIERLKATVAQQDLELKARHSGPSPFRLKRLLLGGTGVGWRQSAVAILRFLRWLASGQTLTKLRWSWHRYRSEGLRGGWSRTVERFIYGHDAKG